MTRLSLVLLLAALALGAAPATLRLGRGETRVLPLPRAGADVRHDCREQVATVFREPDGGGLTIVGKGPGGCTVTVDGVRNGVEVYDARDADEATCSAVKDRLRGSGLSVDCRSGVVNVRGVAADDTWVHVAERLAATYPGVYVNLTPRAAREIEYTVSFLELRRGKSSDVGVDTPGAIAAMVSDGINRLDTGRAASVGLFGPLADQISAEAVLSRFEVLEIRSARTKLGETSRIVDGGTLYKEVSGVETAELEPIEYGFVCSVLAVANAYGYELALDVSVKEQVPGGSREVLDVAQRSTSGVVNVGDGETIVVATGSSNRSWNRRHGVPGLHRIPLLGLLFGQVEKATSPTLSAVMITVSEPGNHPEWLQRLDELRGRLGATWD